MKCFTIALVLGLLSVLSSAQTRWKVSEDTNPIDNSKTATAMLDADNSKDTLILRCTGRRLELYLSSDDVIEGGDVRSFVRVKFDDAKIKVEDWPESSNFRALFAGNANKEYRQLRASKRFVIQYPRFQKTDQTSVFTLDTVPAMECAK